jgi:Kef-type K+ transport system membrane component KefB
MSLRLLALLARLGLGLLLFYATLSLIVALLRSPQVQQSLVACGFLLAALWFLWSKLPEWFREAIRSFWKNRGNDDDQA